MLSVCPDDSLCVVSIACSTNREEGHIKLKVRRGSVLQDSMDAIESIDVADMRKTFRYTVYYQYTAVAASIASGWC